MSSASTSLYSEVPPVLDQAASGDLASTRSLSVPMAIEPNRTWISLKLQIAALVAVAVDLHDWSWCSASG